MIIEALLPLRVHLLALFEGRRERTIAEYSELPDAAGLPLLRTIPLQGAGIAIIEAGVKQQSQRAH